MVNTFQSLPNSLGVFLLGDTHVKTQPENVKGTHLRYHSLCVAFVTQQITRPNGLLPPVTGPR